MTHETENGKSIPASRGVLTDNELADRYPAFIVTDTLGNEITTSVGHRFEVSLDRLCIYRMPKETWKMENIVAIYNGWVSIHILAG